MAWNDLTAGQKIGAGALGGGLLGNALGSFFGGSANQPYHSAEKYLKRIPSTLMPFYAPYVGAGQQALPTLQQQYGSLLGALPQLQGQLQQQMADPGKLLAQLGQGYQQSPGYEFARNQALQAANQSAAAGGMAGTPMAQQNAADIATNLANQDYHNYLNSVLGLHGQGLQGLTGLYGAGLQGMAGLGQQGYGAASDLATSLANALMGRASTAFEAGQAQRQQQQGGFGGLLGGLGSLAGLFF